MYKKHFKIEIPVFQYCIYCNHWLYYLQFVKNLQLNLEKCFKIMKHKIKSFRVHNLYPLGVLDVLTMALCRTFLFSPRRSASCHIHSLLMRRDSNKRLFSHFLEGARRDTRKGNSLTTIFQEINIEDYKLPYFKYINPLLSSFVYEPTSAINSGT